MCCLKDEKERQERELQRRLTEKLYVKRMETYPAVFRITRELNSYLKTKEEFTKEKLSKISKSLSDWVYGDTSFILTPGSIKAYYALRDALEVEPEISSGYLKVHKRRIWEAKNDFHASLKQDLRLLFSEDTEARFA